MRRYGWLAAGIPGYGYASSLRRARCCAQWSSRYIPESVHSGALCVALVLQVGEHFAAELPGGGKGDAVLGCQRNTAPQVANTRFWIGGQNVACGGHAQVAQPLALLG